MSRLELLQVLKRRGRAFAAPLSSVRAEQAEPKAGYELLTGREREVLQLIAGGHPNKQIAWKLGVGEETVKSNIKNIFGKLQVNDRTHAVTTAARRGIIEL